MPPPFRQIARTEFAPLVERFEFSRQINAVHMHHTFRPDHSDYDPNDGHRSIVGMFLFHTQTKGWRDIAQHISIAPDGSIWLGRNWNLAPASAAGHNGNAARGPFMFEIIGNFDRGRDRLEGEQRRTVVEVIATIQRRFGLPPESLRFHNTMSPKSCPGTAVDFEEILAEVRAFAGTRGATAPAARAAQRSPFPADATEGSQAVEEALRSLSRDIPRGEEPADAEPDYEGLAWPYELHREGRRSASDELSAATLAELRPHIVNLNRGRLSADGKWKTDAGDVDAIFDQHLERALADAQAKGEALRVLLFAHGGLVKESAGLAIAHKHLEFWKKNGVYPISFVWETGLFETLGQLLRRSQEGARGFVSDHITDPLTESVVRALQGPRVWGGMKQSAELAVADAASVEGKGGARYVAEKLAAFCARHAGANLELHAVGHSAGSIFHAHFIPTALSLGTPAFKSMHLLAPAIRTDAFGKLLAPRVGKGIDKMTLYTMSKDYEREDNCAKVYRKSLLYLIYHALEADRETPILGLEQSLRADPALVALFGLGSKPGPAEVVFSVSPILTGRSASSSTTHGGFDDDPPTMGSVARRILGKQDADRIFEYLAPRATRDIDPWSNQVDWPERMTPALATVAPPAPTRPATVIAQPAAPAVLVAGDARGRRRALCIGINEYPTAPLLGCVADAGDWEQTLRQRGFETRMLRNSEASREGILRGIDGLLDGSQLGDVLVLQFAGHGTQVPDLNGDEEDQTDEAICPFDFASGALLIDDDIREVFERIPEGVNFTCFFDCCHSGTNTRFAVGAGLDGSQGRDRRARFMRATPELVEAHRKFRGTNGGSRGALPGTQAAMRNVSFSACEPFEVAFESDGHGDFTVRAMRVFSGGIDGLTNEQFQQRVLAGFGAGRRQSPRLDCATAAGSRGFLLAL
jgi:hypothetical protein